MSETSEMPTMVEVEEKNPVVEATRKAVRGALETNEAWRKYRDTLQVKPDGKSVYRAWVDASDKVVRGMTKVDQESLGTKLYEMRMRILAGALQVSSTMVDTTFNVLTWIPRKAAIVVGAGLSLTPLFIGGEVIFGMGAALEGMARFGTRGLTKIGAARHANERVWRYKIAEGMDAVKHSGGFVKERMKQVVEGFAYPEGKPVKPPMAKM